MGLRTRFLRLFKLNQQKQLDDPMPNFHKPSDVNESHFMAPKVAAKHFKPRKISHMTLIVIGSLVVCFLVWATFAPIDVVTRGMGRVIPSQKTQTISNLEGGIIKAVLVKEGDVVQANQVLIQLDPTIIGSQYKTNREQHYRYLASSARLEAQIAGKDYQVPEVVEKEYPQVAAEERAHYAERKLQLDTQTSIARQNMIQKQEDIAQDEAKIEQTQDQLDLSEQELTMVAPLVAEQLISKREILRLKRDAANLKGEIATAKANLAKNQAAFEQAKYELAQVQTRFKNEDEELLRDIKIKLAEEQGSMIESRDRLTRTEIRSPIKGIVKEIKLKTVGGVIRGGEEIMTVVPFEDTLLIEAHILPSDVSFTHPGQDASIKVMAYDYAIYGSLKGKLLEISADTVHDPDQKKDFYRVLLRTDKNYLEYKGKKLPIIPGMTVEADILTGTRTVMQYMLKPFIKGVSSSLTEK